MIKMHELTKVYKDFDLNISMEIAPGSIVGLIGKNGAGKSTTIKAILGLIRPTSGQIEVLGKNPLDFNAKDKAEIGACLADSGFSRMLTVKDVIAILKKMYKGFDEDLFLKHCNEQGLPLDKALGDFSTGMKAKLRVLTTLCHNAKLLILDEPTSYLDIRYKTDILTKIRMLATENKIAVLMSVHEPETAMRLSDTVVALGEGQVLRIGTPEEVFEEGFIRKLYRMFIS